MIFESSSSLPYGRITYTGSKGRALRPLSHVRINIRRIAPLAVDAIFVHLSIARPQRSFELSKSLYPYDAGLSSKICTRPSPAIDVFHKKAFRKGRNRLFFYKKRFFP